MNKQLFRLCLTGIVFVLGCGDDNVQTSRGFGNKARRASKVKTFQTAKEEPTCRKRPPNLVAVQWEERSTLVDKAKSNTLRDPFAVAGDHLIEEVPEADDNSALQLNSVVDGFEVTELKFTMSVTGQPPVFAVLRDPNGFGHDVYIGDIVGTRPRMRVEAITSNEIVFRAVERIGDDDQNRELKKTLLTPEELQELLP